jgi:hypothetical protein
MTDTQAGPFNSESTYVHLDEGAARPLSVDDRFWPDVMAGLRPELERGRLLATFSFSSPWKSWELHPAGEELVILLSGATTLTLENGGELQKLELREAGQYAIIPRGVWHTADTDAPTRLMFLTPGKGTSHKPR